MKKNIMIILILAASMNIKAGDFSVAINDSCGSTFSNLDYNTIMFTKGFDTTNTQYSIIDVLSCDFYDTGWQSTKNLYKEVTGIINGNNTIKFDSLDAEILYRSVNTGGSIESDDYFIDLFIPSDSSYGFVYGDSLVISSASYDKSWVDSLNAQEGLNESVSSFTNMSNELAYVVSLNSSNTYGSGYSQNELHYKLVFDDGANVFERIEDTDRSNELVGFRYYSDRNSSTYTKFIKPNN